MTLGYGEFYPVVYSAKAFVCIYMGVFLGLVSSAIPEVVAILTAKPKFAVAYQPEEHPFIVVGWFGWNWCVVRMNGVVEVKFA